MKRVSLGFFSKNNMGELSAAATTDLSFMEMFAMNMVNTVVNGYITVIVLILFLAFIVLWRERIALAGILPVCPIPPSVRGTQPPKRAYPSKGTGRYGGKFHRVSARDAGGESL